MDLTFVCRESEVESGGQADSLLACYQKALGHELPNQLVALQGLAQLLEVELADQLDAESRGHLQRLAALTRRVDECVRALAQIGRWWRDPGPVSPVALAELACEAAAEVNLLSPGWDLRYDGLNGLPLVAVPRVALQQVMVQLLRNAARAAASDRPLQVTISGTMVDCGVEVSVADNGTGIPAELRAHLGEPFSGGRAGGRFGLGLFLVRQLVTGWKGALRIRSELGRGTTVTFLVPRQ